MIAKELLEILCCPETKQDLTEAESELIAQINGKIEKEQIKNRGGELVKEKIDAGLVRKDGKYLYPVREDIPIMLIDEAIALD